ncbi:MAG: glycine betaine ABC transporter substrate-binding protein [Veillonella sp.]
MISSDIRWVFGITAIYGMDFKDTKDMDIGLKYRAIESGHVDAIPIFTTDSQLSHASVVVLEDDKHYIRHILW